MYIFKNFNVFFSAMILNSFEYSLLVDAVLLPVLQHIKPLADV